MTQPTIHLLPIEPIEERYSADWYRWWPAALRARGFPVVNYDGLRLQGEERGEAIQHGQFLDAIDTHYWKSTQLAVFAQAVHEGAVRDGDLVVLADGWSPAVTSLAYMRAITGIGFKILLVLHAGTWDPWDHLTLSGMRPWAAYLETGWFAACDAIFVATRFHADLIEKGCTHPGVLGGKVHVTGFPLELDELARYGKPWMDRPRRVVFPHRLAREKVPELFDELREAYHRHYPSDEVEWVRSQDVYTDKASLYELLGSSRVAFSSALQETWGIVQLESWYLGCWPVVPPRLSYEELYPRDQQYTSIPQAVEMVRRGLDEQAVAPFLPSRDPRQAWDTICTTLQCVAEEDPR